MYIRKETGPVYVTLPDGSRLSRSDLPPKDTSRWVARRKAKVVAAVVSGLISEEEACETYALTTDELKEWINAVKSFGPAALRVTALQKYRQADP
ncbi:DUF1153 domain-containing protein [Amylibacter sp. IMCC11727]|uniref:CtrA inhibitor SciP n=1 Tax=Amylibacter sp. IMCC11727 TaxID=3039851 RepID=UPI00244E030D|nr:DUF1153 domain-containing protein [Amylibacter sp. IMCC11727]WGI20441.1 DUF1153 domain-containing protein [Amylibacter sp. IMCC11727]